MNIPKNSIIFLTPIILYGCGLSTFTQRETDPFIRDWLGNAGKPINIMVTDSSRRLVYEFQQPKGKQPIFCADAPPDTSIAASGAIGSYMDTTIHGGAPNMDGSGKLQFTRSSGTSTLPLLRRSQGLQWGRDQAATECMLFAMGIINLEEYKYRLEQIRKTSKEIIDKEIEYGIGKIVTADPDLKPNPSPPSPEPAKPDEN